MDTASLDELRTLRTRAYGPSADIHDDAEALRRLHELEALRRRPVSAPEAAPPTAPDALAGTVPVAPATDAGPAPGPASAQGPRAAPETDAAAATPAPVPAHPAGPDLMADDLERSATRPRPHSSSERTPGASRRVSRGRSLLWAASVVASAALAAGVTYAVTEVTPVSVSSGAPQIATLEPISTITVPVGWFGAGPSSTTYEYLGLTLFETSQGFNGSGTECFALVRTADLPAEDEFDSGSWSYSGRMYSGCRVGAFPATIALPIDSDAPQELTDRFPAGGSLQFVLDGDRVGVFLDGE